VGRGFPHQSRPTLWPTQPTLQWVPSLSGGRKRPGRDADPSPPSRAEVQKRSRAIPLLSLRAFVACKKRETYLPSFQVRPYGMRLSSYNPRTMYARRYCLSANRLAGNFLSTFFRRLCICFVVYKWLVFSCCSY
jgi:hypothetical protein